jgi:hypothetical protein
LLFSCFIFLQVAIIITTITIIIVIIIIIIYFFIIIVAVVVVVVVVFMFKFCFLFSMFTLSHLNYSLLLSLLCDSMIGARSYIIYILCLFAVIRCARSYILCLFGVFFDLRSFIYNELLLSLRCRSMIGARSSI